MDKLEFTEYSEVISIEGEEIEVTVQIPKNYPELPVRIIEKVRGKVTIRSENEYSAVSDFIHRAMVDAGYIDEP